MPKYLSESRVLGLRLSACFRLFQLMMRIAALFVVCAATCSAAPLLMNVDQTVLREQVTDFEPFLAGNVWASGLPKSYYVPADYFEKYLACWYVLVGSRADLF